MYREIASILFIIILIIIIIIIFLAGVIFFLNFILKFSYVFIKLKLM